MRPAAEGHRGPPGQAPAVVAPPRSLRKMSRLHWPPWMPLQPPLQLATQLAVARVRLTTSRMLPPASLCGSNDRRGRHPRLRKQQVVLSLMRAVQGKQGS